jgi:hypothetical protein
MMAAAFAEWMALKRGDTCAKDQARMRRLKAKFALQYPHNERDADVAVQRLFQARQLR